jgi:hypothetical protein
MGRTNFVLLAGLALTFLYAAGASAQNLLVNPDFDTDLSGWSGPGVWDVPDAFGSSSSGSATWINTFGAGGALYVMQCVELVPWIEGYDLAGYGFVPSSQPGSGYTYLSVAFFSDAGCSTYITGFSSAQSSVLDAWTLLSLTGWTPNGAASAQIAVANQKTSPGDFQVWGDAIFFGRDPDVIFADGFQSGDTSEWTSSTDGSPD